MATPIIETALAVEQGMEFELEQLSISMNGFEPLEPGCSKCNGCGHSGCKGCS